MNYEQIEIYKFQKFLEQLPAKGETEMIQNEEGREIANLVGNKMHREKIF